MSTSILNFPPAAPTAPAPRPAPTPEQIRAVKLAAMKREITGDSDVAKALVALDKAIRAAIAKVNASADYTPAQAWAHLGADAQKLATGSELTCIYLAQMAALNGREDYVPAGLPDGVDITFGSNGTVTATGTAI